MPFTDSVPQRERESPERGCASQFWVKSNVRVVVDSEGVRRAADECLSPDKHDAQASVSDTWPLKTHSLAHRACMPIPAARNLLHP